MAKTFFDFEKTPQPSARAVLNFMFWLIAMPFRERSREASAFLNPNIWYEPSDLSIAFQAFIVPFHNVAFQRWSYDPASSIYFTISSRLCFFYLIMAYFPSEQPKQVEITKFHRWCSAYERNNISRNAADAFLLAGSRDGNELATKENQQVSHWNGGNKMICN